MEESRKVMWAGLSVIALLAVAALLYFFVLRRGGESPAAPESSPVETAAELPAAPEKPDESVVEPLDIPLDGSDEAVRDLASALSLRPELGRWLLTDSLVRKFVAAVDNIASGQSPRRHIDFFSPEGEFQVRESGGRILLDPAGFTRYDPVGEVFAGLDTEAAVRLYRRAGPLIRQAYDDLGYPGRDFNATLLRAIDELMGVPLIEEDVTLERKLLSYEYTNPDLEGLSPAQKHLFRMGPTNIRRVQAKLREFRGRLAD